MFLICMSFVCLVNAAPPFETTHLATGCEILNPYYEYLPQNQSFDFYWHVYNSTTLLSNTTASCGFHLYSKQVNGEHLYVDNAILKFTAGRDFEASIPASNFTKLGNYCYLIECWTPVPKTTTTSVCGIERCFQVTKYGYAPVEVDSFYYIILIIIFTFLLLNIYLIFKVESQAIIIANICLIYIFSFLIFFVSWLISDTYFKDITILNSLLYYMWLLLAIGFMPFVLIMIIYLYKEAMITLQDNIKTKRGLKEVL